MPWRGNEESIAGVSIVWLRASKHTRNRVRIRQRLQPSSACPRPTVRGPYMEISNESLRPGPRRPSRVPALRFERRRHFQGQRRSIRVAAGETAGDVSTVNGSIQLEDGARADDIETVNGSVKIGRNGAVQSVETVNGGIALGEGTQAESLDTVNGALTLDENARIAGAVATVNGAVRLARNVEVTGDLSNVNGRISLDHSHASWAADCAPRTAISRSAQARTCAAALWSRNPA